MFCVEYILGANTEKTADKLSQIVKSKCNCPHWLTNLESVNRKSGTTDLQPYLTRFVVRLSFETLKNYFNWPTLVVRLSL